MATLLYLDDRRDPFYNQVKFDGDIHWVKDVKTFEAYLQEHGLPDMISFDYILGNMPDMFTDGIGAAKAVIRYCTKDSRDTPLAFPMFAVHSEHEDAYKLQKYITHAIEMYDLGEIRQVGKIHEKPASPFDREPIQYMAGPSQGKTGQQMAHGKGNYPVGYGSHSPQIRTNFTGRNDTCPCGSGKKYKRCCIGK